MSMSNKILSNAVLELTQTILEFLGTVKISATTEKFVAADRFVENTSDSIPVKVYQLGDNFKKGLLNKVEEPIGETILRCQKLRERSADSPIIGELGGEEKAETTLTEMFSLVKQQGSGQEGTLLTNGYANIFYILVNGVLCAVSCSWRGDGWRGDGWIIHCYFSSGL